MTEISNRDIQRLYDKYNPNEVRTGDIVMVSLGRIGYQARVIGLDLDIKNQKVFANLKLTEQNNRHPIRVDVSDCKKRTLPLYPGHHNGG